MNGLVSAQPRHDGQQSPQEWREAVAFRLLAIRLLAFRLRAVCRRRAGFGRVVCAPGTWKSSPLSPGAGFDAKSASRGWCRTLLLPGGELAPAEWLLRSSARLVGPKAFRLPMQPLSRRASGAARLANDSRSRQPHCSARQTRSRSLGARLDAFSTKGIATAKRDKSC